MNPSSYDIESRLEVFYTIVLAREMRKTDDSTSLAETKLGERNDW
jgi:hypothetical protein